MKRGTVYIREMNTTVEGPEPGFWGFVRWLFEPFRPPPPVELDLSAEEETSILAALEEFEASRKRATSGTPKS